MIWHCWPCGAYVGVHKNSPDHAPLGRLANAELRKMKIKAHAAFDKLWTPRGSAPMTRKQAYKLLRQKMNLNEGDAPHRQVQSNSVQESS